MKNLKIGIIVFILTVLVSGTALGCYKAPEEVVCGEGYHVVENECVKDEAEPTPTPTETPQEGPKGDDRGDYHPSSPHFNAPVCTVGLDKPVFKKLTRVNPTTIEVTWWKVQDADHYALVFSYYGDKVQMGADAISGDATSFTITGLKPNKAINVQLFAYGRNCSNQSEVLDP